MNNIMTSPLTTTCFGPGTGWREVVSLYSPAVTELSHCWWNQGYLGHPVPTPDRRDFKPQFAVKSWLDIPLQLHSHEWHLSNGAERSSALINDFIGYTQRDDRRAQTGKQKMILGWISIVTLLRAICSCSRFAVNQCILGTRIIPNQNLSHLNFEDFTWVAHISNPRYNSCKLHLYAALAFADRCVYFFPIRSVIIGNCSGGGSFKH